MINPGVIQLAKLKYSNYRFEIEDNIGEAIHIHYSDMRFDFSINEFLEFADKIEKILNILLEEKNISINDFDSAFLIDLSGLIPDLENITYENIMLEDLLVDTYDANGSIVIRSLKESRVLKALSGDTEENDNRNQTNFFKPLSYKLLTNQERLEFNLERIKNQNNFKNNITLFNTSNNIRDGQHSAACMYYLKGNITVSVRRLWFYNDSYEFIPYRDNFGYYSNVYFDTGQGMSENEKITFETDDVVVGKIIYITDKTKTIRYDPLEYIYCSISNLEISNSNGRIYDFSTNSNNNDNDIYIFYNKDPQIIININKNAGPWIKIKATIKRYSYEEIIDLLTELQYDFSNTQNILSETQNVLNHTQNTLLITQTALNETQNKLNIIQYEINSILNSKSWKITKPLRYIKKIKKVINNKGILLRNPWHWFKLLFIVIKYIFKHGFKTVSELKKSYNRIISVSAQNIPIHTETPIKNQQNETHSQIWNRIKPTYSELNKMRNTIPNFKKQYEFTIIISENNNDTITLINKQIYDNYKIIYGSIEDNIINITGDYVLFLLPGDILHPNALFELCYELNRIKKEPAFIYFDHDYLKNNKVDKPYYKPGWSPDLFLINNYIDRACIIRCDLIKKLEINKQPYYVTLYDILLKISEIDSVHHKPGILLTMSIAEDERKYDPLENKIRNNAIKRRNINGIIEANQYGITSLRRKLIGNPKISIIILTCYTKTYIENCLNSIKKKTTYNNYEIIIVDNSRLDPSYGEERLKKFKCKIIYLYEPFNWSRLNNKGVVEAKGDILLFINDDTEIITTDWLERMASEAQRPEIGMVGPIVLYGNGIIQSAGGFKINHHGGGYHSFLWEKEDSTVYHNLLHYTRNTTYVMGACFMIEKKKFMEAGCLNESLPLECNETDFALRLINKGYNNLTIAEVKIIHFERASRDEMDEQPSWKKFWEIWEDELQKQDIYFNPYLDLYRNDYKEDSNPTILRHTGTPSISPNGIKKIIIVKLDHIGDIVLSLPAIRKLRKIFKEAQIDILCGPWAKNIFEEQPEIDNLWIIDFWKDGQIKKDKILKAIKDKKYDLAINLRKYPDTKDLTIELADYCLLYSEDAATDNISHSIPAIGRNSGFNVKWHFRDQMLSLINNLEYDESLNNEVIISTEEKIKADKIIENMPLFKNNIIIGMHISGNIKNRIYSLKKFAILCDIIHEKINASIVLVGSKDDDDVNRELIELVKRKEMIMSVAKEFSLIQFFYFVKKMDYFIGNNSGPSHVAGIQGVSTLVIYGSRHPSQEWSPMGNTIVVERPMSCSPCYDYDCQHNDCISKINPYDVYNGLERLMILYPSKR